MKNKFLLLLVLGLLSLTSIYANNLGNSKISTKHNKDLTLNQLAKIQPGLGTVMIEFGHRFYIAYYAAKTGNWGLAKYEIDELIEAQEIAEVTRPKYTKDLKAFEHNFIDPLKETINLKNWTNFSKQYNNTIQACNICHVTTGHAYIKYTLPKNPPLIPSMNLE